MPKLTEEAQPGLEGKILISFFVDQFLWLIEL